MAPAMPGEGTLLGSGYQGSVFMAGTAGQRLIVKKAGGPPILRHLRRAMIRRECAVYQRIGDVAGIPKYHGLQDGAHLVLDYVDGPSLREVGYAHVIPDREALFAKLLETIRSLHRAGVAHTDIKRKDNILFGPEGRPYLIDFGAAVVRKESGGFWNARIFRHGCRLDLNAWIKHKYKRRYYRISEADRVLFQPTTLERIARWVRPVWRALTLGDLRKTRRLARRRR